MTHILKTTAVLGTLLATAAVLAAGPTPALAAGPHAALPGNWMYVAVTHGDARSSGTRGALLLCDPPQGHAHAAEACAELDTAGGDVAAIPPRDAFCPMIYAPVTARALGQWNGRPVEYTHTFSNDCELAAQTGDVFTFALDRESPQAPTTPRH